MIQIDTHADGLVLGVHAQPGARKNCLRGEQNGCLKVAVTQAPEKGKANKAVMEVLCHALRLRASQVELLSGETSRHKRFLIRNVSAETLLQRIAEAVEP